MGLFGSGAGPRRIFKNFQTWGTDGKYDKAHQ